MPSSQKSWVWRRGCWRSRVPFSGLFQVAVPLRGQIGEQKPQALVGQALAVRDSAANPYLFASLHEPGWPFRLGKTVPPRAAVELPLRRQQPRERKQSAESQWGCLPQAFIRQK